MENYLNTQVLFTEVKKLYWTETVTFEQFSQYLNLKEIAAFNENVHAVLYNEFLNS